MNRPSAAEIESIYAGILDRTGLSVDSESWNSQTPIFDEVIFQTQPKVIIEAGVWNGGSVIHMANCCKARKLDTLFYAVDVYYGHAGDHIGHLPDSQLPPHWSTPSRYQQFLYNVAKAGHAGCVVPVPNFTAHGARMLAYWGVMADACYVDAGHEEAFALADIEAYWPLVRPGGILFGDDIGFAGVLSAIGIFGKANKLMLQMVGHQWMFRKPL